MGPRIESGDDGGWVSGRRTTPTRPHPPRRSGTIRLPRRCLANTSAGASHEAPDPYSCPQHRHRRRHCRLRGHGSHPRLCRFLTGHDLVIRALIQPVQRPGGPAASGRDGRCTPVRRLSFGVNNLGAVARRHFQPAPGAASVPPLPWGFAMLAVRRFAILVLVALAALATPAVAAETGTPAWLINGTTLLEGPGGAYQPTGELGDETRIRVDRCSGPWCKIHAQGVRGWVSLYNISFGQEPRGPLTGPRLNYPSGNGTVCFYTGRNYSGTAYCNNSGFVVPDALLAGVDNSFSSVSIEGSASVTACRDRKFQSYCERIIESQPALHGFLDNNVSSYRIW
ncbi:MAG: hypothetical protein EOP19_01825 [Hyphomicrobiales bacterium]|nr:MAG: hypothetical protein EOP19_01825 [Hyphomicrobiales bacterium]